MARIKEPLALGPSETDGPRASGGGIFFLRIGKESVRMEILCCYSQFTDRKDCAS